MKKNLVQIEDNGELSFDKYKNNINAGVAKRLNKDLVPKQLFIITKTYSAVLTAYHVVILIKAHKECTNQRISCKQKNYYQCGHQVKIALHALFFHSQPLPELKFANALLVTAENHNLIPAGTDCKIVPFLDGKVRMYKNTQFLTTD